MTDTEPILEVTHLTKYFPVRGGILRRELGRVHAVDDVSFTLQRGQTLGLVGESGCGKSTLARVLVRLYEPNAGSVRIEGRDFLALDQAQLKTARARIQMIFQDPYASLNPRMSVGKILEEPFLLHRVGSAAERRQRVLTYSTAWACAGTRSIAIRMNSRAANGSASASHARSRCNLRS